MPQRILLLYKSFRLNMWYVDKYLHWIIDKLSRSVDGCFSLDSKFTKRGEFCDDGRVIKKNKIRFDNRGMKWAIYVQFAWLEKMGLKGGDQRKWQNHTKIIHFLYIIKSFSRIGDEWNAGQCKLSKNMCLLCNDYIWNGNMTLPPPLEHTQTRME